jgi:maltose alpha-D-glucosyltransferase/alpha-amylase
MTAVMDFWLGMGVDGMRLDAVPYLFEREGTNCENLPETHEFLQQLRRHIDERFPNRMLLAEANQWPEDAVAYFGNGDECHMNFHFPVMPRMFMAIHQEDRFPIVDIFEQTPEVHPSCQWALFLRNHDELTLEMVTDEERDYMYRAYADQAAMRLNLGIRRRLAPLVDNSRRKIELLDGLLFSLPGTPVLYYGDEIGMGDNVYLGDRNGVRTPMQWSMDRNAGFSRANPQRLVLPVVLDPEYHYESLNVENQQRNPSSLLWWTKRLIALRKQYASFGRGRTQFLTPSNARVLAFLRILEDETVLVVANLSRFTQYAEIDLSEYRGCTPVELFGQTRFPVIGEAALPLSLGPHAFYWFELRRPSPAAALASAAAPPPELEVASLDSLLTGDEQSVLADQLVGFLAGRPWFEGRARAVRAVQIVRASRVGDTSVFFVVVKVDYADGEPESYAVPMAWIDGEPRVAASAVIATVRLAGGTGRGALVDAVEEPAAANVLLELVAGRLSAGPGLSAVVVGEPPLGEALEPMKIGRERGHSTLRYGDRFVLELTRRIELGVSPEVEMDRFISERAPGLAPALRASLELGSSEEERATVAVLHAFVPNLGTAWELTVTELGRYYERVLAASHAQESPPPPGDSPLRLAARDPPPAVAALIGAYRETAGRLGSRIAEYHLAMSANDGDPAFAPEPYSSLDRRAKYQGLRNLSGRVIRTLRERLPLLPERARDLAAAILAREKNVVRVLEPLLRAQMTAARIRTHGNLHLGHVLFTGKDFVLAGAATFRGHGIAERRRKRSPLRDLAWMVQSYEAAAFDVLLDPGRMREADVPTARPWALHWTSWTSAALLRAYVSATSHDPRLAVDVEMHAVLFDAFRFERSLYQLQRALDDPSPRMMIPLLEIARMI